MKIVKTRRLGKLTPTGARAVALLLLFQPVPLIGFTFVCVMEEELGFTMTTLEAVVWILLYLIVGSFITMFYFN